MEVALMKMLGFSLGVVRMKRIINVYIRCTTHVRCIEIKSEWSD